MAQPLKKDNLSDLLIKKGKLESNNTVKKYLSYIALPEEKKAELQNKWDKYYDDVRTTVSYERFMAQKEYFAHRDIQSVKDLSADACRQRENEEWDLVKPGDIEPDALLNDQVVFIYRRTCYDIYLLKQEQKASGFDF